MKLSKSKLALAKVINENGGWPSDEANFAAQDKIDGESNDNTVSFYSGKVKPTFLANNSMWRCENLGSHFMGYEKTIRRCKLLPNWHQTCISREEYYHAYPKADADGWIYHNGKSNPVGEMDVVDVLFGNGQTSMSRRAGEWNWSWGGKSSANCFLIEKYRLHKPEVKPELCESVMRSIPDQELRPTIEQLAHDYRNKLDLANRKQQEADDAKAAADAALVELERAGEALGLLIGIAKPGREPELVITDWRDLMVGDVVEITGSSNNCWKDHSWQEMTVKDVYPEQGDNDDQVDLIGESGDWCLGGNTTWRFIRRP